MKKKMVWILIACFFSSTAFCQNRLGCLEEMLRMWFRENHPDSSKDTKITLDDLLKALSDHFEDYCSQKKLFVCPPKVKGNEINPLISSLFVCVVAYLTEPGATFDNPLFEENSNLQAAARAVADSKNFKNIANNLYTFYNILKSLDDEVSIAVISFFLDHGPSNISRKNKTYLAEIAVSGKAIKGTDCTYPSLLSLLLEYCQFLLPRTRD
jgi:hypothetical protein